LDIIKGYEKKYECIKVIQQSNQGQAAAFNTGFMVCTGEIVAFLDADDYWYENKLEVIVNAHKQYLGVQHNLLINNEKKYTFLDEKIINHKKSLIAYGYLGKIPTSGFSFQRSTLSSIFPIPEEFTICADLYIRNMFALKFPILSIDEPLAMYRVHGNNNWFESVNKNRKYIEKAYEYVNESQKKNNDVPIADGDKSALFVEYLYQSTHFIKKKRYIIYGMGLAGKLFYKKMSGHSNIKFFTSTTIEVPNYYNIPTISVEKLKFIEDEWDYIIIASEHTVDIYNNLINYGIDQEKMIFPKF